MNKITLVIVTVFGSFIPAAWAQVVDFSKGEWLDLTHEFSADSVYWPTADRFHKETVFEGMTDGGFYYTAYNIQTAEHGGTHMDAPVHFSAGKHSAEAVTLDRLVGPAVVIDVTEQAAADADYLLSSADILEFEQHHGMISAGEIVLVSTGFARYWPNARQYLGTDQRGPDAVPLLHFPGISAQAAELLVSRQIAAVGIDTASVDHGQSSDYLAHRILYEQDIPGFENVGDMSSLPPRGTFVVALPMKIKGGSGAPLRIVAFVPREQ